MFIYIPFADRSRKKMLGNDGNADGVDGDKRSVKRRQCQSELQVLNELLPNWVIIQSRGAFSR